MLWIIAVVLSVQPARRGRHRTSTPALRGTTGRIGRHAMSPRPRVELEADEVAW